VKETLRGGRRPFHLIGGGARARAEPRALAAFAYWGQFNPRRRRMPAVQIRPNVYWIGVNDRTTDLFEGIWPIEKEGVSYNSYLILDRKKVLIDLSKALKTDEFFHQIQELTPLAELDYIVLNHLEPDHTGVILTLRQLAPRAVILGSGKMQEMLASFYKITENVRAVADGEMLDIGERKLRLPASHWPETMVTYDTSRERSCSPATPSAATGPWRGRSSTTSAGTSPSTSRNPCATT
jgi:hypothetical protein